jgi:hypothetical protein
MKQIVKYSDHQETLIALVTHLAMTDYSSRTPTHLSKALSIDAEEIRIVLEKYKSLFRRSLRKSPDSGDFYYSLQIRYAKQWLIESEPEESKKPPLEPEYLTKLLDFIISKSSEERSNRIFLWGSWITSIVSLIVAALAIIFKGI